MLTIGLIGLAMGYVLRWQIDSSGGDAIGDRDRSSTSIDASPVDPAPPPRERRPRRRTRRDALPSDARASTTGTTLVPGVHLTRREVLAALPELLEEAREAIDEDRIIALLRVAAESGRPELMQLALDALVSDDIAFDLGHRDDTFEALLLAHANPQVGAAAETRLRAEIERGEKSSAFIGGYARLVGASGTDASRAFLEELLQHPDGLVRGTGAVGLLTTGDVDAPTRAGAIADLGSGEFERFLKIAGDGGIEALRQAVLDPDVRPGSRASIAKVLGAGGTSRDVAVLLEAWDRGYSRAAMSAFMRLNEPTDDPAILERAREYVARAIVDEEFAGGARRSAFYVYEYSEQFQTEAAATLLESELARGGANPAARCALREVQKNVRRTSSAQSPE